MSDPLGADALGVLAAWTVPPGPDHDEQEALRRRFVAHLEQHADGVRRACFPAHLTAGTLVLDDTGEHVLLNLHRKARRWFAFGGHTEPDDPTLADVAAREAREESGLADLRPLPGPVHLDEHVVDFCDPRGPVHHLDVRYAAVAPPGARVAVSEESLAVRWWPVSALPGLEPALEPEMLRLVALARERLVDDDGAGDGSDGTQVGSSTSSSTTSSLPGGTARSVASDQPIR